MLLLMRKCLFTQKTPNCFLKVVSHWSVNQDKHISEVKHTVKSTLALYFWCFSWLFLCCPSYYPTGQIPSPLLFGLVIDACCILHQTVSGAEGNCLLYNNVLLRLSMNGLVTLLHFVSLLITIFAALVICIQDRDKKLELEVRILCYLFYSFISH